MPTQKYEAKFINCEHGFTPKQKRFIELVASGLSKKVIASVTGQTLAAVNKMYERLAEKTDSHSSIELINYVLSEGLIKIKKIKPRQLVLACISTMMTFLILNNSIDVRRNQIRSRTSSRLAGRAANSRAGRFNWRV